MKTNNHFDTIGFIISLLLSDTFSASAESLAEACDLPVQQIRKYLSVIFQNKSLLTHLSSSGEIDDENEETDFLESARLFLDRIVSGDADTEPIYLIGMDDFTDNCILLPITPIEASYINNVYPDLIQNQRTNLFEIKETADSKPKDILKKHDAADSKPKDILKKHDMIQEAISRKQQIQFTYKSPQYDLDDISCSPVAIIQNLTTHIFYIKDTANRYYRIDRIKSEIQILPVPSDIDRYIPDPCQKYFWGNEYQNHGDPVHVKIQIKANTSNIIEKIKSDTALRAETGKLYRDNDFYYYEDDILGMSDFRRWLRSYGSSITVIEPQMLITEVIESSRRTLSYYEKLNNSHRNYP